MSPIAILPVVHAALDAWKRVAEARAAAPATTAGFSAEFQKALGSQQPKTFEQKLLDLPEVRSVLSAMPPGKEAQLVVAQDGALSLRVAGWGEQPIQLGAESQALLRQWSASRRTA